MVNLSPPIAATGKVRHTQTHRLSVWMLFIVIAGTLGVVLLLYLWVAWPWISRWGATNEEALLPLPGDDLISNPSLVTTKAIAIQAPPEAVWPWLMQLGVDRGGMYSYLWVEDGLLRLNVTNSDEIRPEWQKL